MPDAKPIRLSTARNIAFGYREEMKKEQLDKMVSERIIKLAGDKATEWCSAMIVVQKPGSSIRTCADLSELNKFVKIPTQMCFVLGKKVLLLKKSSWLLLYKTYVFLTRKNCPLQDFGDSNSAPRISMVIP